MCRLLFTALSLLFFAGPALAQDGPSKISDVGKGYSLAEAAADLGMELTVDEISEAEAALEAVADLEPELRNICDPLGRCPGGWFHTVLITIDHFRQGQTLCSGETVCGGLYNCVYTALMEYENHLHICWCPRTGEVYTWGLCTLPVPIECTTPVCRGPIIYMPAEERLMRR